jgi:hypothetical protein
MSLLDFVFDGCGPKACAVFSVPLRRKKVSLATFHDRMK